MAEAYDIKGYKITDENEVAGVLEEAFNYNGPVLIDCRVHEEENVYPMIAPGQGHHQMEGVKP